MQRSVESAEFSPYPNFPVFGSEEFNFMADFLRDKKVPSFGNPEGSGRFSRLGTFRAAHRDYREQLSLGSSDLWASNLLKFDYKNYRIWINNYGEIEIKPDTDEIPYFYARSKFVIAPGNVWFAKSGSTILGDEVDESGYVISTNGIFNQMNKYLRLLQEGDQRRLFTDLLRESLQRAARGERPGFLTKVPFARVPDEYRGHYLNSVLLSRTPMRNFDDPEYQDMVVIDGRIRTLVSRMVDFPLHPDNWV